MRKQSSEPFTIVRRSLMAAANRSLYFFASVLDSTEAETARINFEFYQVAFINERFTKAFPGYLDFAMNRSSHRFCMYDS